MSTKTVKGLLKGLRCISKVFDEEEGEPEMQIGYPTDVKHVAHIGWDGPDNNNGPRWMNDFKPNPDDDSSPRPPNGPGGGNNEAKETKGKMNSTMSLVIPPKDSTSSPIASPSQRPPDGTKKTRNRRHTPDSSIDSPTKKSTSGTGGHRSSRRNSYSAQGTESTSQDPNASGGTRKVRRRKKVSSEGGSTKSTKSKGDEADPELAGAEFGSQG